MLRGSDAAYVPWMVTDLALLAEQDGAKLRIQAVDAQDGAVKPGAVGQLMEGTKLQSLAFDTAGRAEAMVTPGVRRVVPAQRGASLAILASEGQSAASVRQRLYAFTERPSTVPVRKSSPRPSCVGSRRARTAWWAAPRPWPSLCWIPRTPRSPRARRSS
ncbi:MAG: hypothetical protein IPP58_07480 [Holophagaceae bacterium]|uniref:Uncharacterized protein n=1 Tax=Candidatus Geothrix skivensis TaxID=2954439 RepID=A0A9D7XLB0_9BACT|nr:hypothetical protein [Candidatus Geothrix skivensis]